VNPFLVVHQSPNDVNAVVTKLRKPLPKVPSAVSAPTAVNAARTTIRIVVMVVLLCYAFPQIV
jgi:hypothetical protein